MSLFVFNKPPQPFKQFVGSKFFSFARIMRYFEL